MVKRGTACQGWIYMWSWRVAVVFAPAGEAIYAANSLCILSVILQTRFLVIHVNENFDGYPDINVINPLYASFRPGRNLIKSVAIEIQSITKRYLQSTAVTKVEQRS